MLGTVKWFSNKKGHGFIAPDGGGRDVFVHYLAIEGEGYKILTEGDRVRFKLVTTDKGPQARQVRVVSNEVATVEEVEMPMPMYVDWRVSS